MLSAAESDFMADQIGRRRDFTDSRNWRRSKRGNLTRLWKGRGLTVFQQNGCYKYVIGDNDGPRYSPVGWDTEAEAIAALRDELGM